MASVVNDKNGRKRIGFTAGDGTRRTLRLGKCSKRQADAIKVRIEQLILASTGVTNVVDDETAKWLTALDEVMYDRLAAVGLVAPRISARLGAFVDGYIAERGDVKAGTATFYGHTRRNLIDFFGADKSLREITPGDADEWRLYLLGEGLAENTVRRRCGMAKHFFRVAVRRGLILSNPFEDLKAAVRGNSKRLYFISRTEAEKVLEACPCAEWRLIFALCRYGGLRCPSEVLRLRWTDVDWDRNRFCVHSPKTEHYEGGESRMVPIFPELLPYLREVFEAAETGSTYVITRYRQANVNLRTQLQRIIKKAGLKSWPKLFQNLRSTRETELAEVWPEHVVCAWIGNSKKVAREHYLQVTDEHFERAAMPDRVTNQAAQNPTQHMSELSREDSHTVFESAFCDIKQGPARLCEAQVGRVGFEPT